MWQEWERPYTLTKARQLICATTASSDIDTATTTKRRTRDRVKKARIRASPASLRGRIERAELLPVVEVVAGGGGAVGVLGSVVRSVVESLKPELFMELIDMMGDMLRCGGVRTK